MRWSLEFSEAAIAAEFKLLLNWKEARENHVAAKAIFGEEICEDYTENGNMRLCTLAIST